MKIYILEDDPERLYFFEEHLKDHELTIATDTCKAWVIWKPPYDVICLDHDLGGRVFVNPEDENTGMAFVRDLLKGPRPSGRIYIHSWNPDAGDAMFDQLLKAGCDVHRIYFGPPLFTTVQLYLDELQL